MKTYQISEQGIQSIKRQSLRKTLPLLILCMVAGLAFAYFNPNTEGETNPLVFLILLPVMLLALGVGLRKGMQRRAGQLSSFRIELGETTIRRTQESTPTISIDLSDVQAIHKLDNGELRVVGPTARDLIIVPPQLAQFEDLESQLSAIQELSPFPLQSFIEKYSVLISVLTVAAMGTVYLVENKVIVGIIGILLISTLSWFLIQGQRSKNIDTKTKRSLWLVLLVIVSMAGIVITKLFR